MKDDLPLVEEFGSSDASAPPSLAMEVGLQSITTQEQAEGVPESTLNLADLLLLLSMDGEALFFDAF